MDWVWTSNLKCKRVLRSTWCSGGWRQDDDVLGCGGTILAKKALQERVGVVHMSDGSASHQAYMDRAKLVG
jgi:hypothetical protein